MRDDDSSRAPADQLDAPDLAPTSLDLGRVDIKALLSVALERKPSDDFSERVMSRMAAVTTTMEFIRLVGVAPFHWLMLDHSEPENENENDDTDDTDDTGR